MKLNYSARARADLREIFSYINDCNPRAAIEVVREILNRSESLLSFPLKCPQTALPGVPRLEIARYHYFVFYRIEDDTISIAHIRHTSRNAWRGGND